MKRVLAACCGALAFSGWAVPSARAADIVVDCQLAPAHADCSPTQHLPVDDKAEIAGNEAFAKLKAQLYDPVDPVAQALSLSKWGDPAGWNIAPSDTAFIYAHDKANCIYVVAERIFYYDEGGPAEGGSNEITPRSFVFYLNNVAPKELTFNAEGVFHGGERLFPLASGADPAKLAQAWASIYPQRCKGK